MSETDVAPHGTQGIFVEFYDSEYWETLVTFMEQRLGRPAQDEFKLLCSRAKVTCNASSEDDHGWDFVVSISPPHANNLPADKISAPKQVFVQVKSTRGNSPKAKMKVSNAIMLAKSELPCFVVLFQYPSDTRRCIYIRHFWTELIGRALKRGRQASAANLEPHKLMMEIRFASHDEHSDDLLNWLIGEVDGFPPEYSSNKRSVYETIGYEEKGYRAEVTFGPLGDVEDLIDHQLGLSDYLPVSNFRLIDARFGIDAPNPIIDNAKGRLQVLPGNTQTYTVVVQASTGVVLSLEASVRIPFFPTIPPIKWKILFDTWAFTAIVSAEGKLTIQFRDLWHERVCIRNLQAFCKFLSVGRESVRVKIVRDTTSVLEFHGNFNSAGHEPLFDKFSSVLQTLKNVELLAGVSRIALTLHDLRLALRELSIYHGILTANDVQLCAEWDSTWDSVENISRVLGYFDFRIGELTFFVMFEAVITDWSNEEHGVMLQFGKRMLRDCRIGEDADAVRSNGKTIYKAEENRHGDDCLSLGDFGVLLQMR